MKSSARNGNIELCLKALREIGPMTATEMGRYLEIDRDCAASLLSWAAIEHPKTPKRCYIARWTKVDPDNPSLKRHPRPVYASGDGIDAPRPKPMTGAEKQRQRRKRNRDRLKKAFVFNLGVSDFQPLRGVQHGT